MEYQSRNGDQSDFFGALLGLTEVKGDLRRRVLQEIEVISLTFALFLALVIFGDFERIFCLSLFFHIFSF